MKKSMYFLLILCLAFLIGCNKHSNTSPIIWYETKEEAIKHGLKQERADDNAVLSIQEIDGETIVFYEINNALGVASITESNKGYSWFRSKPYAGFESDSPYSVVGFDFETATGLNIPILAGKAFDQTIQKMKVVENSAEKELQIHEGSRLFFTVHTSPFSSIQISPMKK